jgi:HlyD family secretion protein
MQRSRQAKALSAIALCLLLAGCASWFKKPVVVKPTARAPESFGALQTANAAGDAVDRAWWTLFQDPVLNGLQAQLETGNLNLQLLSAKVRQAQASEQQALSNLRQLRELKVPVAVQSQIQADANFINAKKNLARTLELFDQGFIGVSARDEAERVFQIAQSQRNIDRQQYESLQPGGSEISLVQATVNQARAAVQTATARLRYSTIQAPRAGVLIARHVEIGDGVLPGKVLMTLSPKGVTQLVVQIDEKNIKWLKINQMSLASADAYPDKKFQTDLFTLVLILPLVL